MKVFGFRSRFRTMGNSVVPLPHHVPAGSDALQQNGQNGALCEHANQKRYIGSGSGAAFLIAGAWSLSCVPILCSQFITSWLLQRTPMLGRFNQRYCQTRWPFSGLTHHGISPLSTPRQHWPALRKRPARRFSPPLQLLRVESFRHSLFFYRGDQSYSPRISVSAPVTPDPQTGATVALGTPVHP